jgi:alpha-L-fucosidase
MAMGGNYVLNVGPDENGEIPPAARESIEAVGDWYNRVKEALFAEPAKYELNSDKEFYVTRNENILYVHFPTNPHTTGFFVKNIVKLPVSAVVLNDNTPLSVSMDKMPTLCTGRESYAPVFHVNGIPVNRLSGETIVLKFVFENVDKAIVSEKNDIEENRF